MSAFNYTHINANTTGTQVGPASANVTLHAVTINSKGATANLLTIYDGTSTGGTVIAVVDTTVTFGTLVYDVVTTNGIFVVLAAGTAADLTISWAAGSKYPS